MLPLQSQKRKDCMKRLDQEKRHQIYTMKRAGFSQKTIARALNKPKSKKIIAFLIIQNKLKTRG